jgi:hypothetical protein
MKKKPTSYFRYKASLRLSRKKNDAQFVRNLVCIHELVSGHLIAIGKSKKEDWLILEAERLEGDLPQFGDWPVAPLPSLPNR